MGKYTSLARTLRDEPEEATRGMDKGSSIRYRYVNIYNIDKDIDSNPSAQSSETVTTLRPTTLTTLIEDEKDETRNTVVCIHNVEPEACAVCSGYVRWLIEDEPRLQRARANPEQTRREFWRIVKGELNGLGQ